MSTPGDEMDFHNDVIRQIRETGAVGGWFAQFDMLILHTVGAKSGQPRQNPMAYQKSDGDEIYVFASNNGNDTSSAWYHNAMAHSERVAVEIGPDKYAVRVRELQGAERDRVYATQAGRFGNFAGTRGSARGEFRFWDLPAPRDSDSVGMPRAQYAKGADCCA